MEYFFTCPYCLQEISIVIDISAEKQSYIEDCEVCCRPINLKCELTDGKITIFEADRTQ